MMKAVFETLGLSSSERIEGRGGGQDSQGLGLLCSSELAQYLKTAGAWAPFYLRGCKSRKQSALQEHVKIFSSPGTVSMCFCSWSL